MTKKLLLLLTASTMLYGASQSNEFEIGGEVRVRHLNTEGIQGTFILEDVTGYSDLYKRCAKLMEARPDLRFDCHYDKGTKSAILITYKK